MLWALLPGERTVDELVRSTGLAPSAASQQLRLLRQSRLVAVRRSGRNAYYRLYDDHLRDLLCAIRYHHDHAHPLEPSIVGLTAPRRESAAS